MVVARPGHPFGQFHKKPRELVCRKPLKHARLVERVRPEVDDHPPTPRRTCRGGKWTSHLQPASTAAPHGAGGRTMGQGSNRDAGGKHVSSPALAGYRFLDLSSRWQCRDRLSAWGNACLSWLRLGMYLQLLWLHCLGKRVCRGGIRGTPAWRRSPPAVCQEVIALDDAA